MRVMHVIEAMDTGGAESLVVEHARLAAPEVETIVVALNRGGPALEAARAAGARTLLLAKGGARLAGLAALTRLMRAERIDVVNGHNPTGGLYGALSARLAGVPVVLRTEHSFHFPGRHSRVYPLLERWSTALTDRVVCVCEAVRASHAPRLGNPGRFVVILNGVAEGPPPRPRPATRVELGVAPAEPVVLAVGSLTRQKAQHTLLEALARGGGALGKARLWIAGEGPRRAELESLARALGIEGRVRFLGARRDVADLLEACDVFALPSVREGLSVTLLEAMRAGRASVATRVGGCSEAIEDGVTGRLVPPEDPGSLAAALAETLADPARAAQWGRAARERWRARFTAERMVRESESLYRSELARRRPGSAGSADEARGSAA
jgi:glycosyltransferase involved in cell wall biosynthesis